MPTSLTPFAKQIKNILSNPLALVLILILFCSHDLYIKMDSYFFQPHQEARLSLFNGTFDSSENTISRDRIQDASMVGQGQRKAIDNAQWKDKDSTTTQLNFNTGDAGTYVIGVSTKARSIELNAKDFNDYLRHDGVLDMLEQRTSNNLLNQDAIEQYEKHVKAIYQVGDTKTDDWNTVLGYPIEFVPLSNPYNSFSGEQLQVQLLLNGQPLANQLVYANHVTAEHGHTHETDTHHHEHDGNHTHEHPQEHQHEGNDHQHGEHAHSNEGSHSHDKSHTHEHEHNAENEQDHTHTNGQELRTNTEGIITVDLPKDGLYYLRTIYMVNSDQDGLTHESKWTTLTFEVTHKHDASTHTHDHDHDHHDEGIPTWIMLLGSILIIVLLFLAFRK